MEAAAIPSAVVLEALSEAAIVAALKLLRLLTYGVWGVHTRALPADNRLNRMRAKSPPPAPTRGGMGIVNAEGSPSAGAVQAPRGFGGTRPHQTGERAPSEMAVDAS